MSTTVTVTPTTTTSTVDTLRYEPVPETREDLEWADLETIDLTGFKDLDSQKRLALAKKLLEAVHSKGFLYVKGWNIDSQRVTRQLALGNSFFNLPLEEKLKYKLVESTGSYNGYRAAGGSIVNIETGLKDKTEIYNIPKFTGHFPQKYPEIIDKHIDEIEQFTHDVHDEIIKPLLSLIALALELPEDHFVNLHHYEGKSEDHIRYMKYSPYTDAETPLLPKGKIWGQGHTDLGTLSLLFRQPIAALQIQDPKTNKWYWVKPQEGSVTVNAADTLSFLTGNYIKSTVHRISVPPEDQRHQARLGLLYFLRPSNELPLNTVKSPVLERAGITKNQFEEINKVPTAGEWTLAKQKWGFEQKSFYDKHGAEIIPGYKLRIYD